MHIILVLFTLSSLFATEVDNFTQRDEPLADSTEILNDKVNFFIERAVQISNWEYSCNKNNLYRNLKRQFNLFGWSKFEIFTAVWPSIPKLYPRDVTIFEYFPICGVKLPFTIAPLYNLNGILIGGDKFSHFFNEGWNYFKKIGTDRQRIGEALSMGESDESGFWGVLTTGVYSYADLVANYEGYNFWSSVIEGQRPYVSCNNGQWVVTRSFDWREYVDAGFDEGYNCSSFRNKKMEDAFLRRLKELSEISGKKMSCPLSQGPCRLLKQKYGKFASSLLHPLCVQKNATQGDPYVFRRVY